MTEATYTLGPWSHSVIHNEHHIIGGDGFRVANIVDGNKVRGEPVKAANAQLIAAAPDLLAFAQSIIDADTEGHMMPRWMANNARAAIGKATGRPLEPSI